MAYKLHIRARWKLHDVFHASLLAKYRRDVLCSLRFTGNGGHFFEESSCGSGGTMPSSSLYEEVCTTSEEEVHSVWRSRRVIVARISMMPENVLSHSMMKFCLISNIRFNLPTFITPSCTASSLSGAQLWQLTADARASDNSTGWRGGLWQRGACERNSSVFTSLPC